MQGATGTAPMLRKRSRWQTWTPTWGSERKRKDRAWEKKQWKTEAQRYLPTGR